MSQKTTIVAEIGINHQGSPERAIEMCRVASACGADAVKFQKRNPELYPEKPYNSPLFGEVSYREHKRRLELPNDVWLEIDLVCESLDIEWFASVYDFESLDIICSFSHSYWKIASVVAATDLTLACEIAKQGGTCFMSTGMMEIEELDAAVKAVTKWNADIVLMHCNAEYPTPPEHANLSNLEMLRYRYGLPVGYSSHVSGVPDAVAAVALGAVAVEKHFTLDRTLPGSDHSASLEPHGLETTVRHIRSVEKMLGSVGKQFYEGEKKMREKFKK